MTYHKSILKSTRAAGTKAHRSRKYLTLNVNYPMDRADFESLTIPPHPQYLTNRTLSHEQPAPDR